VDVRRYCRRIQFVNCFLLYFSCATRHDLPTRAISLLLPEFAIVSQREGHWGVRERCNGWRQFRASGGNSEIITAVAISLPTGLLALAMGSTLFHRTVLLFVVPTSKPLNVLKPQDLAVNFPALAPAYHCWLLSCLLT
jgi:hypothetical protein